MLRMNPSREQSLAVNWTAFGLPTSIRDKTRRGGLSTLILVLSAVHLLVFVPSALAVSPAEGKNGSSQQWSLRVDKVDTDDVSLNPSFESALHKNLLREVAKTKRFKQVLLNGDRNANDVSDLLILQTTVQEHASRGEARRGALQDEGLLGEVPGLLLRVCGWSRVSGVSKLTARIRLYTREGRLVLDEIVSGDVGFTGDNSQATHNLAHNVAVSLKRSTLPDTAVVVASEGETASVSK
jgi:hypothetical protein